MSSLLLAAERSVGDQILVSLVTAVSASVLTVAVSWLAILRRKVERRVDAQVDFELAQKKGRFDNRLLRQRELVMRILEKEMLEPFEEMMGSAYRARNAVRDLATLTPTSDERPELVQQLSTAGGAFQRQIMDNRIKLNAVSAFDEAHALKNSLLTVLRAERAGRHDDLTASAALVESSFQRFDGAIKEVLSAESAEES